MRKLFTLVLVMAMAMTSFAQVKSMSRKSVKAEPVQAVQFRGTEEPGGPFIPSNRSIMTAPDEVEMSLTTYDWQTNAASRNFLAVWPDGYAVVCFTQATTSNYSDRGTGLAIWDPAVGEWEYTDARVENEKTGFGAIARYKENGLVVAAHTANECKLYFCEDFKTGGRDFSTVVTLPNGLEPTWPCVQCSGSNLDIVHVLASQYTSTDPFENAIRYYRYENNAFTADAVLLEPLNGENMGGGGSNITYFLPYDPAKPNRVSFVVNDAWVDGKVVISEDNGATWGERVFYQHPGIHTTFEDVSFHYPRWVSAQYDENDEINLIYEWNGSTGEPGSGSYYPTVGGVGFWSESLPKSELCRGGIGEVGQPFIMDSCYMNSDLYYSEWYWSDKLHDPLPEYFGELQILDQDYNVWPWQNEEMPETYYWVNLEDKEHGHFNSGIAAFPSMFMDGDRVFAFWSMIAGDETIFYDNSLNKYRLFACMSTDRGRTWHTPVHLLTDMVNYFDEMVFGQVVPVIYSDAGGDYIWYVYANDMDSGAYVMFTDNGEDGIFDDNQYRAVKVYVDFIDGVEEPIMTVATMMNVYPNPSTGSFRVQLNNAENVNIYNTVGQLVKTYDNVTDINVNLESGIYFVNAGNQTTKVVVK